MFLRVSSSLEHICRQYYILLEFMIILCKWIEFKMYLHSFLKNLTSLWHIYNAYFLETQNMTPLKWDMSLFSRNNVFEVSLFGISWDWWFTCWRPSLALQWFFFSELIKLKNSSEKYTHSLDFCFWNVVSFCLGG